MLIFKPSRPHVCAERPPSKKEMENLIRRQTLKVEFVRTHLPQISEGLYTRVPHSRLHEVKFCSGFG